jgi:hypothetical protein
MKRTAKEITSELFKILWEKYLERVSYAKTYNDLVLKKGGKVVIDHIAFRTINSHTGEQPEGIRAFRHILMCLGFNLVAKYNFQKKNISAVHFEHESDEIPKVFVSQLEVDKFPEWAKVIIQSTVRDTKYLLSDHSIELLNILKTKEILPLEAA